MESLVLKFMCTILESLSVRSSSHRTILWKIMQQNLFFNFLPRNTYWNRRLCLFYLIHQQGKTVWVFCSAQMCEHPCNIWVQSGYLKPSEFAFDHSHCIDTRTIGTMIKVTDNSTENVHGIIFNFYSNKKDLSVSRWWGKCKLIHGLLQKMKHWWK